VSFRGRKEKEKAKPVYLNMACLQRLQAWMSRNSAQQSRVALLSVFFFSKKERITLVKVPFPCSTFSLLQLVRGHNWHKLADFIFDHSDAAVTVCILTVRQLGGWLSQGMQREHLENTIYQGSIGHPLYCFIHRH